MYSLDGDLMNTGIQNEFDFVLALNCKKIKDLNPMLLELIYEMFGDVKSNEIIKAWRNHFNQKTDILIKIGEKVKRISIKMGSRNSVHEESLITFVAFLRENKIPEKIIRKYLLFHYGDGTINGTGVVRNNSMFLRNVLKDYINDINYYFNNQSFIKSACDRFIIKGLVFDDKIDALIYGTPNDFLWIKRNDIYAIMKKKMCKYSSSPHIGFLTIQPLNRCINYNYKYEYARHKIQLKWYTLFDDIIDFMNDKVSSKLIT